MCVQSIIDRCSNHGVDVGYKQFLMLLAAVAFRAFAGDPSSQVRALSVSQRRVSAAVTAAPLLAQILGLLQHLDASRGKDKVNGVRSSTVIGKFNLLPLCDGGGV